VFAILDNFQRTPEWNDRCVEVRQTSEGAHAPGAKLVYRYRERGREGEMTGVIAEYDRDRKIRMHYTDKALDIDVTFELVGDGSTTKLTHVAEIQPRTFLMKLMSPVIRGATRKQTEQIVGKLRALAEAA
jgi:hypothetical protein